MDIQFRPLRPRAHRAHGQTFSDATGSIVAQPEARTGSLRYLTGEEQTAQAAAKSELKEANLSRFKRLKPQTVTRSRAQLVKMRSLRDGENLPRVVEPDAEGVDLRRWAQGNVRFVREQLLTYGAMLFRGFGVRTIDEFGELTRILSPDLIDYAEPSSPRTELSDRVYTSTEYPPEQSILLHNELSYAHEWPQTIYFYCQQPAARGWGNAAGVESAGA